MIGLKNMILKAVVYSQLFQHISPIVQMKEQVGYRPSNSGTSQLLYLNQYIEDGYHENMITGTAFVDLSAVFDTVNHRLLIQKHNTRWRTMYSYLEPAVK